MYKKPLILAIVAIGIFTAGLQAVQAFAPTVSAVASGNGDTVQLTVTGDANSNAILYYQKANYGLQSQFLGSTNSNGYLSTSVSTSSLGLNPGSTVYVSVNNQQSGSVSWPYNNNYNQNYNYGYGNNGTLSLSQTSVSVAVGQSVNVTIYGGSGAYSMYPSVPNIFRAVIGGNTLQIIGENVGNGSLNICSSGTSMCATVSVTVGSNVTYPPVYYGNQISLSQNSISLNTGNSATITVSGNGGYYISNNANSSIASATINGNSLTVYGQNYGSTSITVCQNNNQCAVLYVTVGYGNPTPTPSIPVPTGITFSQTAPTLSVGQSTSVSVYGGYSSSYYIAYNSNSSALQAALSGNTLSLTGLMNSTAALVICSTNINCGALNVTVGSSYTPYNPGYQNNWTFCASENQYCSVSGSQQVRYGANGNYVYRWVTGSILCSNATFGDPAFGYVKQCTYGGQ